MAQRSAAVAATIPGVLGGIPRAIPGVGGFAAAGATQQVLIPQVVGGQTQYVTAQIPAPQPQYVFDPATNTYYQLPAAPAAAPAPQLALGGAAGFPYAGAAAAAGGIQLIQNPALATAAVAGSPIAAPVVGGGAITEGQLGSLYSNETSTFGPARTHLGVGHQPISSGTASPQVVYSSAAGISAGESVASRGYHPYGR